MTADVAEVSRSFQDGKGRRTGATMLEHTDRQPRGRAMLHGGGGAETSEESCRRRRGRDSSEGLPVRRWWRCGGQEKTWRQSRVVRQPQWPGDRGQPLSWCPLSSAHALLHPPTAHLLLPHTPSHLTSLPSRATHFQDECLLQPFSLPCDLSLTVTSLLSSFVLLSASPRLHESSSTVLGRHTFPLVGVVHLRRPCVR